MFRYFGGMNLASHKCPPPNDAILTHVEMTSALRRLAEVFARKWPQLGPVHQQFYVPGEPIRTEKGDKRILLLVPRP